MPSAPAAGAVALCNAEGVATLVEHLVAAHALDRLAYVGPPAAPSRGVAPFTHRVGRERLDGFRAAVGRAGLALPPEYVRTSDPACTAEEAAAVARELLTLPDPPQGIIAGADTLAMGVLDAARGLGMDVPGDVALVSFDEPAYADLIAPPITSLDRHDRQLGRRAAEMLLDALGDGGGPLGEPEVERVPLELLVRRSCGCPAG